LKAFRSQCDSTGRQVHSSETRLDNINQVLADLKAGKINGRAVLTT